MANSLTHRSYDKAHLEATRSIVESLDKNIRSGINDSRLGNNPFNDEVWKAIREYGTLTASNAKELSLIDADYPIEPLKDLVAANDTKDRSRRNEVEAKWGARLNFPADHEISLAEYSRTLARRKRVENRSGWVRHGILKRVLDMKDFDTFLKCMKVFGPNSEMVR